MMDKRSVPARNDGRIIIHFDYDCFYAAVFEARNPALKHLPFAVQQKQIIVTCNYEARRRGLHKLMLIKDARTVCPEVIIELGEDISQFRDASKELYKFIEAYTWNGKVERLGFDEVWLDVTDMIDYNMEILNKHDLQHSFFQMSKTDLEKGFSFDATTVAGNIYPADYVSPVEADDLTLRLRLGSHLAFYMRQQVEEHKNYTSTVGIATTKLISKLVGNLKKPNGQTTLMPPLHPIDFSNNNAVKFMDDHEIGKVPGIGFKLAQKLRAHVLKRPAEFDKGLVYGGTHENVKVKDLRCDFEIYPEMLETLLGGPGSPHGIGYKVWCLLHGVDDSEVSQMRSVPRQISIEDSYIRLDTMPEVLKELTILSISLITRMRIDLLGPEDGDDDVEVPEQLQKGSVSTIGKKWLAHPKTLRLTTRPRQALQFDGTRPRSFKRISHSAPLPTFIFKLSENIEAQADKLVKESLIGMFRKLHPEKAGWNLSLVNLAVTNMAETAGDSKTANGRDIGNMFKRQDDVLRDFKVSDDQEDHVDDDDDDNGNDNVGLHGLQKEESITDAVSTGDRYINDALDDTWESEGENDGAAEQRCMVCGSFLPSFAMAAHQRFHEVDTTV